MKQKKKSHQEYIDGQRRWEQCVSDMIQKKGDYYRRWVVGMKCHADLKAKSLQPIKDK